MRNEYLMKIFYPFIGNKYYLLNETASVTMCNLTGTSAIRKKFCIFAVKKLLFLTGPASFWLFEMMASYFFNML